MMLTWNQSPNQLNMIIAMMSHTYEKRKKLNDEMWKVEIFSRIIRYEKLFPELWGTAHKPNKVVNETTQKNKIFFSVSFKFFCPPFRISWEITVCLIQIRFFCRQKP